MSIPSSIKITKNGVTYLSNVDRTKYTIKELSRAALRDVGKYIARECRATTRKRPYARGLRGRNNRNAFGYWVRKVETDLQVGSKANTWYGALQELGDSGAGARRGRGGGIVARFTARQPRLGILTNTTQANIDTIRRIEGQYLSAVENENRALGLISEGEYTDDGD